MFGKLGDSILDAILAPEPSYIALPQPTNSGNSSGVSLLQTLIDSAGKVITTSMAYNLEKKKAEAAVAAAKAGMVLPVLGGTATTTQQLLAQQQQQQLFKWALIGGGGLAAVLIIMKAKGGKK